VTASHSVIMLATTTSAGPAISSHGQGSRYHGLIASFAFMLFAAFPVNSVTSDHFTKKPRLLVGFTRGSSLSRDMEHNGMRTRLDVGGIDTHRDRKRPA